jgi:transposase
MGWIRLAKRSRDQLLRVARSRSANARHAKRAKALLGLHHGKSVQQVADETGLSRQAIYNLQKRFVERRDQREHERVKDAQHTGRPPKKQRMVSRIINKLLRRKPRHYGYEAEEWTVAMLHEQVEKETGASVSRRTIRRAWNALRPRRRKSSKEKLKNNAAT